MPVPVVAVVTGYPRNAELINLSFPSLRALKAKGIIQRIVYVTWDTPEFDPYVAPAAAMPDVELVRVPQPELTGTRAFTGVMYQVLNLEAALALIPDDDSLVLKTRTDFVIDQDFLESKIVHFDELCAPSDLPGLMGVPTPPAVFSSKIWVPWADANQPFACEDAAFLGRKRDLVKLAEPAVGRYLSADYCNDPTYGEICYIGRYYPIFEPAYPIFQNFLGNFHLFPNTMEYRRLTLRAILRLPFFWHFIIANAWLLATNFHVDCGMPGQLVFYSASVNKDWSSITDLKTHPPYDEIDGWRKGQEPGGMFPGAGRLYGRLVDDSWQHALFTQATPRDITSDAVREILRNVATYPNNHTSGIEAEFYGVLGDLYKQMWLTRSAA